jgi:exportin-2 (importin alpha re-exporter)
MIVLACGYQDNDLSSFDKMTVKSQLVPIMVSLSTTGASRLQSQIGEAVAEIAELDFPERWPTLIDVSKSHLLTTHSG